MSSTTEVVFDIITCCSALVLLPDPAQAIKHWAGLLKAYGKMIIDVPTEDKTLQHLLTVDVRHAVGTPLPYERDWIGDIHSLEEIYTQAGLKIDRSFRTRSYLPEKWYGKGRVCCRLRCTHEGVSKLRAG